MTERRRPTRRGRGPRPQNNAPTDSVTDSSPYREDTPTSAPVPSGEVLNGGSTETPMTTVDSGSATGSAGTIENTSNAGNGGNGGAGNGGGNGGGGGHHQHGRRRGRDKEQRDGRS